MTTSDRPQRPASSRLRIVRIDPRSAPAIEALKNYVSEMFERSVWKGDPDETEEIDEFLPPGGGFVLASDGDLAVGCGGIRTLEEGLGEIKRMWVSPRYRRTGVATAILAALEELGLELGHERLRLDTNSELVEAIGFFVETVSSPSTDTTMLTTRQISSKSVWPTRRVTQNGARPGWDQEQL